MAAVWVVASIQQCTHRQNHTLLSLRILLRMAQQNISFPLALLCMLFSALYLYNLQLSEKKLGRQLQTGEILEIWDESQEGRDL